MISTNGKTPDPLPAARTVRSPRGSAALIPGNPGNSGGKKGRSGRPPDWLRQQMAKGREKAVKQILALLDSNGLDVDQMLRLVKEWAPPEESKPGGARVTIHTDGSVTITSQGAE